jgi:hypothetical protein
LGPADAIEPARNEGDPEGEGATDTHSDIPNTHSSVINGGLHVAPALDHAGFREALARSRIVFKDDTLFETLARRVDGNGDGKITFK